MEHSVAVMFKPSVELETDMKKSTLLLLVLLSLLFAPTFAEVTFESPVRQVGLLELYTSEGCSSCPPAGCWLSGLTEHSGLWKDFVPVAFHVDYWDYIGWPDRYATPANSKRQRQY